jgi:hypothetical protein
MCENLVHNESSIGSIGTKIKEPLHLLDKFWIKGFNKRVNEDLCYDI